MDADPRHSNGDHDLASSEYRSRLLTKLNCLISVLEAAIAKVTKGLEAPDANEERLVRIRANLENTLAICTRARRSLQKSLLPPNGARPARSRMGYRDYVELSSIEEYRKFKTLPPIAAEEIRAADLDDLLRRLAAPNDPA